MEKSKSVSIIIKSTGSYIPKKVLTNQDLAEMVDTSDEWIRTRTGIEARRIASDEETPSFMGAEAARSALKKANLEAQDIDLIIVATMTSDMPFPPTATLIQHALGARPIPAFDVQVACSGYLYAFEVAHQMLQGGQYKHALVIGAEKLSSIIDWKDRSTCVLFGDGAGAAILSREETPDVGVIDNLLFSDGERSDILCMPAGGSKQPASIASIENREHFLKMNGREVFKIGVRMMEQSIRALLEKHNLSPDAIACIIPHQANYRILESLSERLSIPLEKFFCNLQRFGNTSAASIPIALDEALAANRIQPGDLVVMVAFGSGLTWGASLIRWQ